MRIGVISDTHIQDKQASLPKVLVEALKKVDMIVHAGDFVDFSTYQELKKISKNIRAVCGNMDPGEIKNKLPEKDVFQVGKFKVGLAHGIGSPAGLVELLKEKFKNDDVDIIIFGHSHTPMNETKDGILFFNPGSPTDKVFSPYNSYGIIDINDAIDARIIKL